MPSNRSRETPEPATGQCFRAFRLPAGPGSVLLMLVGELDLVTAGDASAAIRRAQARTRALICDLGDVWFIDLAGLRVLLDASARARLAGARLTVTNCPPIVADMLAVLRLEGRLDLQAPPPVLASRSSGTGRDLL